MNCFHVMRRYDARSGGGIGYPYLPGMAKQRKEGSFRERKLGSFRERKVFYYERKISVGPREIFYVSSDTIETI